MKIKTVLFLSFLCIGSVFGQTTIEKWKIFEVKLNGPTNGNPFTDIRLQGKFIQNNDTVTVSGFYDGAGIYKIRFMPQKEGKWSYITASNSKKLDKKKGNFLCTAALKGNFGPVVVADTFHFAYANGKPYYPFGTTCYAWVHQGDSLAEVTLKTLSKGYFNKMRMCIFPKDYDWNKKEPFLYPFEGKPLTDWDYTKFNPAYFRNIEKRIAQLDSLGIEADLIVFHPYDRWGFKKMDRKTDDRYINYIIARFAAYKNVWWSMANEYDFMAEKKKEDWDHYIQLFAANDPYNHLRSIHHGSVMYDHTNPLLTHASIQNEDTYRAKELRNKFKKPIIYDECRYEGNINWSWGNLTAEEMVNKFWRGVTNGGYVGHGETYLTENPVQFGYKSDAEMWWSKGGVLRGKSQERIKFLKTIIESAPGYLTPVVNYEYWMPYSAVAYKDEYFLNYYNMDQPRSQIVNLPKNAQYKVEIINGWDMTITPVEGEYSGKTLIQLPQKPFTAIRCTKEK
ncbi:DUF5605 domain-containing protein [Paludibacter jiangxiensis]|uniref:DUF5060 domain-containing protein n=1 Tax=Paludibacter jiangxiensis TaxID=681398 RepID=A0A170YY32_9BACT|nr:DUF5060 domain-containing protein [Paludibacter jiangxiensis]GAT62172.1 hypothetical protein PJIAN_1764 [Paludibacter jiangxiensis]